MYVYMPEKTKYMIQTRSATQTSGYQIYMVVIKV